MGDVGASPNLWQESLNPSDDVKNVQSVFQIAAVMRPLMSVGRICDEGHKITSDAVMAVVKNSDRSEMCRFHKTPGGLYVAKMKSKNPIQGSQCTARGVREVLLLLL